MLGGDNIDMHIIESEQNLPRTIRDAVRRAQEIQFKIRDETYRKRKCGRPPKNKIQLLTKQYSVFVTDSEPALNALLEQHQQLIGMAYRGNKRRGKSYVYSVLLVFFCRLRANGITLPRNKSLSLKALELGINELTIGDFFRQYKYTTASDIELIRNSNHCRKKIAIKMNGLFTHVARIVDRN
jgi:hypothetical protein